MIALGLGLGPRYSHAAPEGPNPFKEQVEKLNAQAVEKFQAKQYDEAAALFEQAYELQPEPNYLFNIGRIYEESGNLEKSVEYYERFVKEPGVPLDARERGLERLRVLRAILEETAPEPEPEPDPDLEDPEPEPETKPETTPEATPGKAKPSKLRIAGYALLGVGGGVLIGGGVLGGLALGRANALEGQHTFEERDDTATRGRSMALGADIMFGVGGAVAAAGLVMVLVSLKKKPSEGARAGLSPWAGPRGTGLTATVRF
jgi:tetratricopeptide (TPR) repeat protein